MVRKKVVLRREEILDATVEQIKQRGIATTRITDVAGALGVSSGLIYYHFATKEQLIEATFTYAVRLELDEARAVLSRPAPPLTRMKALLRLYSPTAKAAPGWRLWIDGYSAGLRDKGLRTLMEAMDEEWKRIFTSLIGEGMERGEFHCPDARAATWRITLFLDGLAVPMVARRGALRKDEATAWMREHTAATLGIDARALGPGR
ncbi:TetR/AcrR family transcriptional regulator [Streptomyces baarnensis]|uniref:TetR/AcrR family transcriptional regulator n=1 Tax=Streptomyces TaxID=1883 RepID=UPI0029B81C8E|nr:TetR/AcrR family transcriptional regulator [Streptomyces sp. ME02-6979.5a]MDX3342675.1 TetR/AcrR family transcriptional regulator [Streptomyces sp. ME02-6979.5a]